jgi:hypothetical protein
MLLSQITWTTDALPGWLFPIIAAIALIGAFGFTQTFASAEEAVKGFVTAARNDDDKKLSAIFGPDSKHLTSSGDAVADAKRRAKFLEAYDQQSKLVPEGDGVVIVVGSGTFPLPSQS